MPLQRKVSPHFKKHRKESLESKKKKNEIKKTVRRNLILENLYYLPKEVKLMIFKMAVLANMGTWEEEHKEKFYDGIRFLDIGQYKWAQMLRVYSSQTYVSENNINWLPSNIEYNETGTRITQYEIKDTPVPELSTVCKRFIKNGYKNKENLRTVLITRYMLPMFLYRRTTLSLPEKFKKKNHNIFWFHKKCRCIHCDSIRMYASRSYKSKLDKEEYEKVIVKDWCYGNKRWVDNWLWRKTEGGKRHQYITDLILENTRF